jgi:hypothetical protein
MKQQGGMQEVQKEAKAETQELVGVELRGGWSEWKQTSRHKARMARQHQ